MFCGIQSRSDGRKTRIAFYGPNDGDVRHIGAGGPQGGGMRPLSGLQVVAVHPFGRGEGA